MLTPENVDTFDSDSLAKLNQLFGLIYNTVSSPSSKYLEFNHLYPNLFKEKQKKLLEKKDT